MDVTRLMHREHGVGFRLIKQNSTCVIRNKTNARKHNMGYESKVAEMCVMQLLMKYCFK